MQVALTVAALVAAASASDVCTRAFGECGANRAECCAGTTCVVKEDGFAQCLAPKTHERSAEQSCTNVSVLGDATYCVKGPICGDNGDACPKKGDVAVADCLKTLNSYVDAAKCVAPTDAVCQKIPSGARGCVFGSVPPASTSSPATSTAAPSKGGQCSTNWSQCNGQNWPHGVCCQDPNFQCNYKNQYLSLCEPKSNGKEAEQSCTNVSVVGDATYCVKGPICGDNGDACPKKGDVAVADCLKTLNSYVDAAKCVAPTDAVCQKIPSGARGCVFGAVAAQTTTASPATTAAPATTTSSPQTTTAAPANNTTAAPSKGGQCSTNWSQCNGQNWPYGVCCQDPNFQCNKKNEYLSLCEPKSYGKDAEVAQVAVWQQCGGNGYKGDVTCTTGNKCIKINDWYFQCQPDQSAPGLPTWSQCAGSGIDGQKQCRAEDKCQKWNDYYSQCIPK